MKKSSTIMLSVANHIFGTRKMGKKLTTLVTIFCLLFSFFSFAAPPKAHAFGIDDAVEELVGLGVPGLVLLGVMSTAGCAGAAAFVSALSTLGGPMGMMGGAVVLYLIYKVSQLLAKVGFEKIAKGVVKGLIEKGKSKSEIIKEIKNYPLISNELRQKLICFVKHS